MRLRDLPRFGENFPWSRLSRRGGPSATGITPSSAHPGTSSLGPLRCVDIAITEGVRRLGRVASSVRCRALLEFHVRTSSLPRVSSVTLRVAGEGLAHSEKVAARSVFESLAVASFAAVPTDSSVFVPLVSVCSSSWALVGVWSSPILARIAGIPRRSATLGTSVRRSSSHRRRCWYLKTLPWEPLLCPSYARRQRGVTTCVMRSFYERAWAVLFLLGAER